MTRTWGGPGSAVLVLVVALAFGPAFESVQAAEVACAELPPYLEAIELGGRRAVVSTDLPVHPDQPPSRQEYLDAAGLMRVYAGELGDIDPPAGAATYHALLRDGAETMADLFDVMAVAGLWGVLGYENELDAIGARISAEALALESACDLAIYDHDGDGIEEPGFGDAMGLPTAGSDGSRAAPLPIGNPLLFADGWEVTVLAVDPGAAAIILDSSVTNDPPPDGEQYVLTTVRVTRSGDEPGSFDPLRLRAVGPTGVPYSLFDDDCGVVPDALRADDLGPGRSSDGNVCWAVRVADLGALVVYDRDAPIDERRYLALVSPEPAEARVPVAGPIG